MRLRVVTKLGVRLCVRPKHSSQLMLCLFVEDVEEDVTLSLIHCRHSSFDSVITFVSNKILGRSSFSVTPNPLNKKIVVEECYFKVSILFF